MHPVAAGQVMYAYIVSVLNQYEIIFKRHLCGKNSLLITNEVCYILEAVLLLEHSYTHQLPHATPYIIGEIILLVLAL